MAIFTQAKLKAKTYQGLGKLRKKYNNKLKEEFPFSIKAWAIMDFHPRAKIKRTLQIYELVFSTGNHSKGQ